MPETPQRCSLPAKQLVDEKEIFPKCIHLVCFDTLDSTNSEALRLIKDGRVQKNTVILANQQSEGRGRRNAQWISPAGNLYMTIVSKVAKSFLVGQLSFVAGLAIYDSVKEFSNFKGQLYLKWPNDVLLCEKKLGGILIESFEEYCAVGIGVNLIPVESLIENIAISLSDIDLSVTPCELASRITKNYLYWCNLWTEEGFIGLRKAWLERVNGLGKEIVVKFPNGKRETGIFKGIDEFGRLLFEKASGNLQSISSAEIFLQDNEL